MQVDASARRAAAGGSGIRSSLALVRSLVELHGGSVTATSAGWGRKASLRCVCLRFEG